MVSFARRTALAPVILSAFLSLTGQASEFNPDRAAFECLLSSSESLYLFDGARSVFYHRFSADPEILNLSSFEAYQCPYCFKFVGTSNGNNYEGITRAHVVGGAWEVLLKLQVNGAQRPEYGCIIPKGGS